MTAPDDQQAGAPAPHQPPESGPPTTPRAGLGLPSTPSPPAEPLFPIELTTKELAAYSGLTSADIDAYQADGLIAPTRRTPRGYRRWHPQALRQLVLIRLHQEAGADTATIAAAVTALPAQPTLLDWRADVWLLRLHLTEEIDRLLALERELVACGTCQCRTPDACRLAQARSGDQLHRERRARRGHHRSRPHAS